MLRNDTPTQAAFRREYREWVERHLPADLRYLTARPEPASVMPWYRALARKGWIAPHWPREHGGMGADAVTQVIMMEEGARLGTPDLPTQGLNHIGPLLIRLGTPAQRAKHLGPILDGDVIWCQGYSEPGAGSDLASLRTRARIDGDELVINGHKIWTTWGQHAQWMFALVRTGAPDSGRNGITFVLVDLATPGITRRPIRTIAGDDEFCEVFLDDVRVPMANVVGEIDGGWKVANTLLNEERVRVGSPQQPLRALERTIAVAQRTGAIGDPVFVDRLAGLAIEVDAIGAAFIEATEAFEAGIDPGQRSSYMKIHSTETVQRLLDLQQEAVGGAAGLPLTGEGRERLGFCGSALQSRRLSIYGGTNEIQRQILATRVLGLPN